MIKLKEKQELLEEPNKAFAELRHLRHNLTKERMFNYEDADSDEVKTLIKSLEHLQMVAGDCIDEVQEQTGLKYSSKYGE